MTFNLSEHDAFVKRHGEKVSLYKGYLCPCGSSRDAGRAKPTCTLCHGTGTKYDAPVSMTGIITGVERQKSLLEAGILQPGDLQLGLSPYEHIMLTDGDLIELSSWTRGQPFEGEIVQRGVDSLTDVLLYKSKQVFKCFSVDPNTDAETVYAEGTSFTVAGNLLTWVEGQPQPDPETFYSIKYAALFSWVVLRSPSDRYEQATNIGQKVYLRLRHLVLKS